MDYKQMHRWKPDLHDQRKNLAKGTLSIVNAGLPHTKYLYYPLHGKGVTKKTSLLPAHVIQNKY